MDDPSKPIEKPDTKTSGVESAGFGKLVAVMAQAQGVNMPNAAATSGYRQQVLLVAVNGCQKARFSVLKEVESLSIEGLVLAKNANDELLDRLGVQTNKSTK